MMASTQDLHAAIYEQGKADFKRRRKIIGAVEVTVTSDYS